VTLKSRLPITQGHRKRHHSTDRIRLIIIIVIICIARLLHVAAIGAIQKSRYVSER